MALQGSDAAAALPLALKARDLAPEHAEVHKLLGRIYTALDKSAEAILAWTRAAELDPIDPTPHYRLFRLFRSKGDNRKANQRLKVYTDLRKMYGTD